MHARTLSKSAGVKRLMREAQLIQEEEAPDIHAAPLPENLFIWHFTIYQPSFKGIYHGQMILPNDYPLKPPDIYLLTPNGRFSLNEKICLSITSFHQESWSPAWNISHALRALSAYFDEEAKGAIGGLDVSKEERARLAKVSGDWTCPTCNVKNKDILPQNRGEGKEAPQVDVPEQDSKAEEKETLVPSVETAPVREEPQRPVIPARPSPKWVDRLIACLLCCLAYLLVRKFTGKASFPLDT